MGENVKKLCTETLKRGPKKGGSTELLLDMSSLHSLDLIPKI